MDDWWPMQPPPPHTHTHTEVHEWFEICKSCHLQTFSSIHTTCRCSIKSTRSPSRGKFNEISKRQFLLHLKIKTVLSMSKILLPNSLCFLLSNSLFCSFEFCLVSSCSLLLQFPMASSTIVLNIASNGWSKQKLIIQDSTSDWICRINRNFLFLPRCESSHQDTKTLLCRVMKPQHVITVQHSLQRAVS